MDPVWDDDLEDSNGLPLINHPPSGGGGPWNTNTYPGCTATIDTSKHYTGTSSCKLRMPGNSHPSWMIHAFAEQTEKKVETVTPFLNVSVAASHTTSVQVRSYANGKDAAYIYIYANRILYYNGSTLIDSLLVILADTWYKIKTVLNSRTKKYSAWVAGGIHPEWTNICTDMDFKDAATWGVNKIGEIRLQCNATSDPNIAYFDDVTIKSETLPPIYSPLRFDGQPFSGTASPIRFDGEAF